MHAVMGKNSAYFGVYFMKKLILDTLLERNKVGTVIADEFKSECGKPVQIITPYISDVENLIYLENSKKVKL